MRYTCSFHVFPPWPVPHQRCRVCHQGLRRREARPAIPGRQFHHLFQVYLYHGQEPRQDHLGFQRPRNFLHSQQHQDLQPLVCHHHHLGRLKLLVSSLQAVFLSRLPHQERRQNFQYRPGRLWVFRSLPHPLQRCQSCHLRHLDRQSRPLALLHPLDFPRHLQVPPRPQQGSRHLQMLPRVFHSHRQVLLRQVRPRRLLQPFRHPHRAPR